MSCPLSYKEIDDGFKVFPKVDLNFTGSEGISRFGRNHALCHYSIIDNKVQIYLFILFIKLQWKHNMFNLKVPTEVCWFIAFGRA